MRRGVPTVTTPSARSSREETTARILDAAEELFSRRDPAKVTIREIAAKADVTHPLVHQYVGTKSDIIDAVIARGAPQRQRIMAAHPEFREAAPLVMADVLERRIHSKSVLRASMDDAEYADFSDRVASGQMFLGLATEAARQGHTRLPARAEMDPGVVLAALTALSYGWVALEEPLRRIYLLEQDPDELRRQMIAIGQYLAELVFPVEGPPDDAVSDEG